MFESDGLNKLYAKYQNGLLQNIVDIEEELRRRFYNMDDAIESLLLAAMTGEALVLIGPPGTAKSRLIRSFCNLIGLVDDSVFLQQDHEIYSGLNAKGRNLQFLKAAKRILEINEKSASIHSLDIVKLAIDEGLLPSNLKSPDITMRTVLNKHIDQCESDGKKSMFVKFGQGSYGLAKNQGNGKASQSSKFEEVVEVSEDYFEYLLTQFTEPSELFGYYDFKTLFQEHTLVKLEDNMMQRAKVVFLDEVFNASSAILNSLLTFMNERKLHDRGEIKNVNLKLLVAATNHPPRDPTLKAVYDRFLLRCRLKNVARIGVEKTELVDFVEAGWTETHGLQLSEHNDWFGILEELEEFQQEVDEMSKSGELSIDRSSQIFTYLTQMVSDIVKLNLSEMTNRRIVKMTGVMLAHRLLEGARQNAEAVEMSTDDLKVITRYSIDRDDPSAVAKISQHLED